MLKALFFASLLLSSFGAFAQEGFPVGVCVDSLTDASATALVLISSAQESIVTASFSTADGESLGVVESIAAGLEGKVASFDRPGFNLKIDYSDVVSNPDHDFCMGKITLDAEAGVKDPAGKPLTFSNKEMFCICP